jgi:glutamate-1-semialdehyde aminotransferase
LEVIVAERLVRLIPCGRSDGMVRFVKTGTEAGHAAIRIARAYTGREPIIAVGYHGWSDTFMAAAPDRRGIPEVMSSLVTRVPYGDLDAMSAVLLARPHAAVMMEPVLDVIPDPSYLPGVRNLCENTETLLIFDEVVSGFRWHIGGAQAYFGVTPDLATFGKAMAGGLPLAAIVGPRPIMEIGGRYISGTFGGESLSLAAANAVLDLYEGKADGFSISYRRPVIERLWEVGELLFRLWPRHLAEAVGASLTGYSVHPVVKFRDDPDQIKMSLFLQEVLLRGVLIHPGGFNTSAVHSDENVAYTAQAFTEALLEVEIALSTSTLREALRGLPIQPGLTPRPASA